MVMGPRINCSVFQKLKYFTLMLQENQKEIFCKKIKINLHVKCGVKAGSVTVVKPRPKSVKRLPVWSLL